MNEKNLIEILLDKSASVSERDDAAMDLSAFDTNEVVDALLKVGKDNSVDDIILSSIGESLAEIWLRNKNFNLDAFNDLCDVTKFAIKENMDVTDIVAVRANINPKNIHFIQRSIKNTTVNYTVFGNAKALSNGSLNPNVLRMNVWKDASGKIWALDCRYPNC